MTTDIFYFSGTGNSFHIAKSIQSHLQDYENETVTLFPITAAALKARPNSSANRIGFIYPTYDLDAPKIVKRFVEAFSFLGVTESHVFVYVNSGGMPGNAISSIKKILDAKGISLKSTFDVIYPDNSVLYPIELGEKLSIADKKHRIDAEKIRTMDSNAISPYSKFSFKYRLMGTVFDLVTHHYFGFKDIRVNSTCIGCNTCEKVCPADNIVMIDERPSFKSNCEMCFACIHACPKQSLKYKRMPKRDGFQYRHPEVPLKALYRNESS